MTLDEFWDHIRATKSPAARQHAKALTAHLATLPPDEIIDFAYYWSRMLAEAHHWRLWHAAYIINGGCSDDGFEYFRDWLVLQGRDVFETAVADPDTLADVVPQTRNVECECYPGRDAWFAATGKKLLNDADWKAFEAARDARHPSWPRWPKLGERWDFGDRVEARKRLPRLAALFLGDGAGE
ncbi:MAG: DUF4240 domain-containing protein [Gemmataceae bacterium]|nr:DUF4240 domain-containing protein [Gemmataceae bacterium]